MSSRTETFKESLLRRVRSNVHTVIIGVLVAIVAHFTILALQNTRPTPDIGIDRPVRDQHEVVGPCVRVSGHGVAAEGRALVIYAYPVRGQRPVGVITFVAEVNVEGNEWWAIMPLKASAKAKENVWYRIRITTMDAQQVRDTVRIAKHSSGRAIWEDTVVPPGIKYTDSVDVQRAPGPNLNCWNFSRAGS
ncbi:hypothetical protein [Sphaerisporangium corydalis]|uniref:Uncharacterized protein n=1 Tax=Sphaerisporangium corydalis TaxID=1441875 RepID=A0ABV9ES94_9ACTN|nr:hypothetical protein [Sphaerisporangium corydalis]